MKRSYYVAVILHERTFKDGQVHWVESEDKRYSRALDAKYEADRLNEKYRTPDRFYSARMVWK